LGWGGGGDVSFTKIVGFDFSCYEYEKTPLRNLQTFTRQNQSSLSSFHHIQDVKKIVWICYNVLCKWDFGPMHNIYMFNKWNIYN